ncbi:MAG: hypothetical protein GC203_12870 [Phenylobacterium sp.]|uniref:terminase small subunit-like protein n=1 Tax=Phenylobacterium sp. TaxID=1871053 RepID=UPI0025CCF455|nr:hypothetical protein [Phenylobacterium sp.]MBI1198745.1 hypothetical protein [Phenylobacterium sp.]
MPAYTPADRARFAEPLFHRLAAGESLDDIAATPGWPSRPTLRKWAREDPDFRARISGGQSVRRTRVRFPFRKAVAEAFLLRVRRGEPVIDLIRDPAMPQRRELTAWKRADPLFAAEFEQAKAAFDADRRRYGWSARGHRRSRWPYDEALADRVLTAVRLGLTLPELVRDRAMPTKAALLRWRRDQPVFDAALRSAMREGHRQRGRARTDAHCSPELMARIETRLAHGASLHSLARERGMPGLYSLYRWVRARPEFAAMVARACQYRDGFILPDKVDDAPPKEAAIIRRRLGLRYPGQGRE